jgi:signal transduction histidine kinase/phage shock protein PspC (stress-responsive transcriptional regulator)
MTVGVEQCDDRAMPAATTPVPRWAFRRSKTDRIMSGVAGGIAERLGVDPLSVRAAFVILSVAGGVGIALYLVALLVASRHDVEFPRPIVARPTERSWAVVCFAGAALLILRRIGFWTTDAIAWPLVLVVMGSLVVWLRRPSSAPDARRLSSLVRQPPRTPRIIAGLVVSAIGIGALSFGNRSASELSAAAGALATVVVGLALIVGPGARRMMNDLADERRARIRGEEKAAVSAHIHDSVLQTLTLIQRNANNPDMTMRLAREQERELRNWLYRPDPQATGTIRSEFEAMTRDVERIHDLTIEFVPVGDAPLDETSQALVQASREALVNVGKHAGVTNASCFVEISNDRAVAFIRDRGVGFQPKDVADDRRGIRDSIVGRLERNGGTAEVTSIPGVGTEVELAIPLRRSASAGPT